MKKIKIKFDIKIKGEVIKLKNKINSIIFIETKYIVIKKIKN
jgi:hypothetical protein